MLHRKKQRKRDIVKKLNKDLAGQTYWNRSWDAAPRTRVWAVESGNIRAAMERSLFLYMSRMFAEHEVSNKNKLLIEVGCAGSAVLPLIAKKFEFQVAGIDYSPIGCEQARIMLDREGVEGDIYCCDIFSIPDALAGKFDVVVSFGLIEHFSDTTAIVNAVSRLVKPGGLIFASVPNMNGLTGLIQKILDKDVYRKHVPLTAEAVRKAHERAGLDIVSCGYFLSINLGVVNINSVRIHSLEWWMKKVVLAVLARVSMAVWLWERFLGPLPESRVFSPYINCVATKPNEL